MKNSLWLRLSLALCAATVAPAQTSRLASAQVYVTRTNLVERWVTNLIDIRMPLNRFVNEYQTNWVEEIRTNHIALYGTNRINRFQTNVVWVNVFQTNVLDSYRTNLKTLHLTNWTTVIAFKTNWVTQPLTNFIEFELPAKHVSPPEGATAPAKNARSDRPTGGPGLSLLLEARRNARPIAGNKVEVELTVRCTDKTASPLLVQQWRVERDDGSILCFGQDQQFTRALPLGQYKVEVKVQRNENSPLFAALGMLAVMPREVNMRQTSAARVD